MIISKTPFRISFFGGGTDYPDWCRKHGGAVLSTTINKYCYITVRHLPPFFEHKHRLVYSKIENVRHISEIMHPVVRAVLERFHVDTGLEIHHDGDLPARAGLGSSSSFTVGILNSLYALHGKIVTKQQLAEESIYIERQILRENGGLQDQVAVAHGGFNKLTFFTDCSYRLDPVTIHRDKIKQLQNHLMLIFTGFSRIASEIADEQIRNIPQSERSLFRMQEMVEEGIDILNNGRDIADFGTLMHEAWKLKKELSYKITTLQIDNIYDSALKAGALGGKLLGAGGGGFMLLFVPPEYHNRVRRELNGFLEVDFSFENDGSQIIYYNNSH